MAWVCPASIKSMYVCGSTSRLQWVGLWLKSIWNIPSVPRIASGRSAYWEKEMEADNGLPADVKAEAARKAEERLKYMTFYSTTQDCLRGFLLHYFGEAAPKKCGNCSCCLAAEQEAQLQIEYSRRRAADNARRLSEKPRRARTTAGELSEFDQKLLNALYAQRKRLAGKQNIPAFMVFSDATLREMVEKKPRDMDELIRINGVGEHPAEKYGKHFLTVINREIGSRE